MEKDVTRGIEEQLSAFLDGELPEEEVALLVRRLERDDTYRMTLTSYAAIGGVLRNEPRELGSARFRAGVMNAIDNVSDADSAAEVAPAAARRVPYSLIATAAAAGFVAVLVGVFRPADLPAPDLGAAVPPQLSAAVSVAPPVPVNAVPAVAAEQGARLKRERMTSYLISHGQQTGSFPGAFGDSRMYVQQASFAE